MKHSKKKRIKYPIIVIILGPPGSGKGTQSTLLAEKFDIFHLETSAVIEEKLKRAKKGDFVKVEGKKYFLLDEKHKRDSGELMSPPLITFWIKEKVKELFQESNGIVFSGSPRTLYEAKEVIPFLKKLYRPESIRVILIKLSAKDSIWRNSHRRICELARHSILYNKETKNLKHCPFDGSKLLTRKDDNPETIRARLKEYKKRTLPIVSYLKDQKIEVKSVDGAPTPATLHKKILKLLGRVQI